VKGNSTHFSRGVTINTERMLSSLRPLKNRSKEQGYSHLQPPFRQLPGSVDKQVTQAMLSPAGFIRYSLGAACCKMSAGERKSMKNTVLASLEFYFKGEHIEACACIDLDACLRQSEPMHYIYHAIAAENSIGLHTYEFDVMIMEPIGFSQATGVAVNFLKDSKLDFDGLHKAWEEERIDDVLQPIAHKHLGIARLGEHPELRAALIAAYLAR